MDNEVVNQLETNCEKPWNSINCGHLPNCTKSILSIKQKHNIHDLRDRWRHIHVNTRAGTGHHISQCSIAANCYTAIFIYSLIIAAVVIIFRRRQSRYLRRNKGVSQRCLDSPVICKFRWSLPKEKVLVALAINLKFSLTTGIEQPCAGCSVLKLDMTAIATAHRHHKSCLEKQSMKSHEYQGDASFNYKQ